MLTSDCVCFLTDSFAGRFPGGTKDKSTLKDTCYSHHSYMRLKTILNALLLYDCEFLFSQGAFSNLYKDTI